MGGAQARHVRTHQEQGGVGTLRRTPCRQQPVGEPTTPLRHRMDTAGQVELVGRRDFNPATGSKTRTQGRIEAGAMHLSLIARQFRRQQTATQTLRLRSEGEDEQCGPR